MMSNMANFRAAALLSRAQLYLWYLRQGEEESRGCEQEQGLQAHTWLHNPPPPVPSTPGLGCVTLQELGV